MPCVTVYASLPLRIGRYALCVTVCCNVICVGSLVERFACANVAIRDA